MARLRPAVAITLTVSLVACGTGSGAESPATGPTSPFKLTGDEFMVAMKACVEGKGFPVDVDVQQRGFSFDLGSDELVEQAKVAMRACTEEVDPARANGPPHLNDQQLAQLYQYVVAQVNCLQEAGYPAEDPPSEQSFIDSGGLWDPYQSLSEQDISTGDDLIRCQSVEERPAFVDW